VLRKMPLSCNIVFDVLRALTMGEAAEVPIRELAEMCRLSYEQTRRALKRLRGAHLITWKLNGPGRGHCSVFQVRWALPGFPQLNDSPYARETLKPQRFNLSFCKQKTRTSATPQLRGRQWAPSECAIRWALARARDRLWGLPKPRRERAMDALARAFRWAARQPGPWDRDRWRRFVLSTIAKFEGGPDGFTQARRRPYSWGMRCAQDALTELSREDTELKATAELVARIRREREAARRDWTAACVAPSNARCRPVTTVGFGGSPTLKARPDPAVSKHHLRNPHSK